MPPKRQLSRIDSSDEIYFEPIDNQSIESSLQEHQHIKQDVASEDDYPREIIVDTQNRRHIGAYAQPQGGLPAEKGYPIQIGSELFRLSGASIMSDAPSYFSKFFEDQIRNPSNVDGSVRTLFIDRDPETFKDIARHLQGYHIHPKDGQHYVKLFMDAQFYSLPRLNKQLFNSEIYIQIGEQDFRIPKDIFSSPGDSPNFFSLGFGMFFNHPEDLFPGLDREGLIRPPPVEAPRVQGRSASTFADLLQLLRGYPLHIRNAQHRAELLRDCRYYHLKGLEQKIVFHDISFNPERNSHEIVMRIEDLRQPGISIELDSQPDPSAYMLPAAWVKYARPYADDTAYDLIFEIGDESTRLDLTKMRLEFFNQLKTRMNSLFQVLASRISSTEGLLGPLKYDASNVRTNFGADAHIVLDGDTISSEDFFASSQGFDDSNDAYQQASKKRKTSNNGQSVADSWLIIKAQWRIRIMTIPVPGNRPTMEIVLHAVKVNAVGGQKGRNRARKFLTE